ncbi:MAG: DciA family protein [Gammaproteobacteria bacterium]|nr:DciA family protein [Gammaproteobacteria bacterium]
MSFSSIKGLLFREGSPLKQLETRTLELQELQGRIQPLIPDTLRPYVQVTGLSQGTVTLSVTDASRATRARLLGPTIVKAMAGQPGAMVKRVKVRVARADFSPHRSTPPPRRCTAISPDSARLIRSLAGDADDTLARALRRLASRAKRATRGGAGE